MNSNMAKPEKKKGPSALKFLLCTIFTFNGFELVEKYSKIFLYCEHFSLPEMDTTTDFCLVRNFKCCNSYEQL